MMIYAALPIPQVYIHNAIIEVLLSGVFNNSHYNNSHI
jgi:hypothetical protein